MAGLSEQILQNLMPVGGCLGSKRVLWPAGGVPAWQLGVAWSASLAGGHSPSLVALAAGSCTPTGRWSATRRPGIRSGGRLDAKTTTCTLDTKAQLARGVEQLDHVWHAGPPVLSAPSPRHTDCHARAPLAGISPSSFSSLLSLASSSCSIFSLSSRSLSPSQDSTA